MSTSCALDRFKNLSSHEKSLYKIVHQFYRFFNVIYVIHHILDSSFSKRDRKTNFILFHLKKTEIMHTIGQFFCIQPSKRSFIRSKLLFVYWNYYGNFFEPWPHSLPRLEFFITLLKLLFKFKSYFKNWRLFSIQVRW